MNFSKLRTGDLLIIVVLVIIGVSAIAYSTLIAPKQSRGNVAIVEIDGEAVEELNLAEDIEALRFDTPFGYNIVKVEDSRIRISEASCPDLLCVHTGWRERVGQVIVCLPNRLIVRITGDDVTGEELDSFTY